MNKVIILGNIVKDADMAYTKSQKTVVKFNVAVNEGYGEKKSTQFFNIVSFGAEKVCDYLTKGTKVLIQGRLQNGSYEKDGIKHYTTDIIADNYGGIELLGKKNEQQQSSYRFVGNEDMTPVDDGDIPF